MNCCCGINVVFFGWQSLPPANEVWGKVIFSQACVKNSVQGVCACSWGPPGPGVCLLLGVPSRGGGAWSGGLVPGRGPGPYSRGKLRGIRPSPPPDGYCCGRYASYWNALLFSLVYTTTVTRQLIKNKRFCSFWCLFCSWQILFKPPKIYWVWENWKRPVTLAFPGSQNVG